MREIRLSGSEGGGANPIVSPYPYQLPRSAVASTCLRPLRRIPLHSGATCLCWRCGTPRNPALFPDRVAPGVYKPPTDRSARVSQDSEVMDRGFLYRSPFSDLITLKPQHATPWPLLSNCADILFRWDTP